MQKLGERESARPIGPLATGPSLAVQFFLVPLTVVAVVVAIYGGFRLMVAHERTPGEYLSDVRSGGRDRRWPAAYELSRLMDSPDTEVRFPELAPALVEAFVDSEGDEPRVRRYLALAIGRLQSPPTNAVTALSRALDDPDTETLITVIWALGSLGDESVVPLISSMYQFPDPGVRKMVVYALGVLPDDGSHTTLRTALDDPVPDVQWNAAVSLARHGDGRGVGVLRRMLDRDYVSRLVTPSGTLVDPASDVIISGLRAVASLDTVDVDVDFGPPIKVLAEFDPSLKVRQAAMETLKVFGMAPGRSAVAERR